MILFEPKQAIKMKYKSLEPEKLIGPKDFLEIELFLKFMLKSLPTMTRKQALSGYRAGFQNPAMSLLALGNKV